MEFKKVKEEVKEIDRQYNEIHEECIKKDEEIKELHESNTELRMQVDETDKDYFKQMMI